MCEGKSCEPKNRDAEVISFISLKSLQRITTVKNTSRMLADSVR